MGYIKRALEGGHENNKIFEFLKKEGFKEGKGVAAEGTMHYVVSDAYTVWFDLCEDRLSLYSEYNCGGCIAEADFHFDKDDFESFIEAYKESVEWAKNQIK
ncbi:hypothetical protein P4393_12205 [Bacillus subtilis]|nr:hypothetical protein [Bacillus subtilis]MED3474757.1 hypothetical protein [Bacillus subtilis]